MASAKSWIKAARLRTLPLAVSGIVMGSGLAYLYNGFDWQVSLLALATAILLQVFSNFANDYGDFQKGTDNQHRVGPTRTMQGGEITKSEMKTGMFITVILSMVIGFWMVWQASWEHSKSLFFCFLGFGLLSLLAAYFYTAGKKSYGYVGLGDLAVFIFFGLLPVAGVYFLNTKTFKPEILLPAITIGFFSAGVLNLNNMRDMENDSRSGKKTLAIRMGKRISLIYHSSLIIWGWFAAILFTMLHFQSLMQWLFSLSFPLFISDLIKIAKTSNPKDLDPFLKKLAIGTFLFTLLFCFGMILAINV